MVSLEEGSVQRVENSLLFVSVQNTASRGLELLKRVPVWSRDQRVHEQVNLDSSLLSLD